MSSQFSDSGPGKDITDPARGQAEVRGGETPADWTGPLPSRDEVAPAPAPAETEPDPEPPVPAADPPGTTTAIAP